MAALLKPDNETVRKIFDVPIEPTKEFAERMGIIWIQALHIFLHYNSALSRYSGRWSHCSRAMITLRDRAMITLTGADHTHQTRESKIRCDAVCVRWLPPHPGKRTKRVQKGRPLKNTCSTHPLSGSSKLLSKTLHTHYNKFDWLCLTSLTYFEL